MLPLENITIGQLFDRTVEKFPDNRAFDYCGKISTYTMFSGAVDRCARRLLKAGVKKGDHVGIWCETEPNAIVAMIALSKIGAVVCMLGTSLQRSGMVDLSKRSDISMLLIGAGYKDLRYPELCEGIQEELPMLREIYYIGEEGARNAYKRLENQDMASEDELLAAEALVKPEDPAFLLYTSGTTSVPKAVLTSHFSRANSGILQAADLDATDKDVFLLAMPIFHCFCISVNIFAAIASGACISVPASRRTIALLNAISRGRVTILSCVPALFDAIISRSDFENWDLSSLRTGFIGGSSYTSQLFEDIEKKMGITLLSSLGQTEATAGLTTTTAADSFEVRRDTVGHFMAHVEGKIADPATGKQVEDGVDGEICIRGYNVMMGYYNPPEKADAIDSDGWLHTGDLGHMDGNGNVILTGRLKELIIRGGENISPAEIEGVMSRDPAIDACKAVGVPDPHYGEEVCLCVILERGARRTEAEIKERLRKHLAYYKVPRYILILDSFPRTATGKIKPSDLKEIAIERLGL